MVTLHKKLNLKEILKLEVENHHVLKNPWLLAKHNKLTKDDLLLWLSQEYFVSVDFVNWFLLTAAKTNDIESKIILVENIWEELGEGKSEESHVSILVSFLKEIGFNFDKHKILDHTKQYLTKMKEVLDLGFFESLGALGPANEYLLKLEYGMMFESYNKLSEELSLPNAKFFKVNLNADEGHSAKLFQLIEDKADSPEKKEKVILGNKLALDARMIFYKGL
ncbi:MAG: iron-containing redox enzyme family protein [Leptospiraceae bacterium]|nr:iron-containing redox enzyme family protein [Leptospiraceae bacterium]